MFQGFSEESIQFLWELRFNNERPWFEAHKSKYLNLVQEPMRELTRQVYTEFTARHSDLPLISHVSRIYRDARRLYGRGPYKSHLWFSLKWPGEEGGELPVFWFQIAPEGYSYGLGMYPPRPAAMAKFRHALDQEPERFLPLAKRFEAQTLFSQEAERYKRKKGEVPPPLEQWYDRKTIDLTCTRPAGGTLYQPDLVQELLEGFEWLLPYHQYILSVFRRTE